jgi:acyl-CoA reductase-like NAD-dependent aldehyde dehydrogenase
VIGRVTLGDEEDARRAIAAVKRAFGTSGRSTKEERSKILRRLHEAVSARIDDMRPGGPTSKTAKPLPIAVPATLEG